MYCGNNRSHPDVLNGELKVGTRYGCFKKGIGVGMNMPYDPSYKNYDPIDNKKVWCGEDDDLPEGYDVVGSNSMCRTKGIGVGKKIRAEKKVDEKVSILSIKDTKFRKDGNIYKNRDYLPGKLIMIKDEGEIPPNRYYVIYGKAKTKIRNKKVKIHQGDLIQIPHNKKVKVKTERLVLLQI